MRVTRHPRKKQIIMISIIAVMIIGLIIAGLTISSHNAKVAAVDTPKYDTILPGDKSIKDLGGWDRISPPTASPVYAFADSLSGTSISVSEQPLPDSFKTDTDAKIAELAKSYNATDKINADGTDVYIGTSAKGPQSTIFIKDNLLVLIKSGAKIQDKTWITYIDSLK